MASPRYSSAFGQQTMVSMTPPPMGAFNTPLTGYATPPVQMNEKQKEQFEVI
jgi:hypothetical protein